MEDVKKTEDVSSVIENKLSDKQIKKRDIYLFASGSCFEKHFEGRLENVGGSGSHPVYRYAKTMFLEVE